VPGIEKAQLRERRDELVNLAEEFNAAMGRELERQRA
jgi:hypothetical protein